MERSLLKDVLYERDLFVQGNYLPCTFFIIVREWVIIRRCCCALWLLWAKPRVLSCSVISASVQTKIAENPLSAS